ncbi:hypothetical protein PVAP13_5NG380743 [Panicum virgatum]|uniref:Uncharacterized protein n=1 Tax=Panicum virgatum TaxID=38727 RepID=A0A8T0RYT6_PANVG|nr:hypothetical protein PVAP13_5NG380743 [Panicum virgatum]
MVDKTLVAAADAPGNSSTKTQKSDINKGTSRSPPSTNKKVAKKPLLVTVVQPIDKQESCSDSGAATSDQNRSTPQYSCHKYQNHLDGGAQCLLQEKAYVCSSFLPNTPSSQVRMHEE